MKVADELPAVDEFDVAWEQGKAAVCTLFERKIGAIRDLEAKVRLHFNCSQEWSVCPRCAFSSTYRCSLSASSHFGSVC